MSKREPWTDPRLRAAWITGDWGKVFREYRRVAETSQLDLGSMVDLPQPHVSLIESGKRKVTSAAVILRITEGLNVPDELRGLSASTPITTWQPDPELADRIAHSQRRGTMDLRSAEWIARVLAEHRRAEDVIGGVDLWRVVKAQLDAVTNLLPDVSGQVADRLLVLSAEHAHWLSWVAYSRGLYGPANAWLDLAYGWSIDAGSADLSSWITRVRAYYTRTRGDSTRAVRIADTARRFPGNLNPAVAAIATHEAAMATAAIGDRDVSRRLADEAFDLAIRTPHETDRPAWLYWLDPARAKLNRGDAAYAVRDWPTAVAAFEEALTGLEGFPRDHAYYVARLEDAKRRV